MSKKVTRCKLCGGIHVSHADLTRCETAFINGFKFANKTMNKIYLDTLLEIEAHYLIHGYSPEIKYGKSIFDDNNLFSKLKKLDKEEADDTGR